MSYLPYGSGSGGWIGAVGVSGLVHAGVIIGLIGLYGNPIKVPIAEPEKPSFLITLQRLDSDTLVGIVENAGVAGAEGADTSETLEPLELSDQENLDALEADSIELTESEVLEAIDSDDTADVVTAEETENLTPDTLEPVGSDLEKTETVEAETIVAEETETLAAIEPESIEPINPDPEIVEPDVIEPIEVSPEEEPEPELIVAETVMETIEPDVIEPIEVIPEERPETELIIAETVTETIEPEVIEPATILPVEEPDTTPIIVETSPIEALEPTVMAALEPVEAVSPIAAPVSPVVAPFTPVTNKPFVIKPIAPTDLVPDIIDTETPTPEVIVAIPLTPAFTPRSGQDTGIAPIAPAGTVDERGVLTPAPVRPAIVSQVPTRRKPVSTPPPSPPSERDLAIGDLLGRIRNALADPCMIALPRRDGEDGIGLALIAAKDGVMEAFAQTTLTAKDAKIRQTRTLVDPRQCAVLNYVRQNRDYPATRLGLHIDQGELASGDHLTGVLRGVAGRYVVLFLVDDNGVAQDLQRFLTFSGNFARFDVPVNRAGNARDTSQILIAVASNTPMDEIQKRSGQLAETVFAALSGELSTKAALAIATFDVR